MTESLAGNLLVASSISDNPLVNRSVCLLVHDDESGAIGVMLNRPIQPHPKQLLALLADGPPTRASMLPSPPSAGLPSAPAGPPQPGAVVHFGGPLSGPIVAIHTSSEHAEAETGAGIYVAAQKEHLEHLVRHHPAPFRLIVGHLGWSAEQLRDEIRRGFWHVMPATTEAVFARDEDMWPRLIRRATAASVASWIGTPDVPEAAWLN